MAAFTEELLERIGGPAGIGVGIAALLVAPKVARPLGRGFRSLAKGAIKGYLVVANRARAAVDEASEEWRQLYAEVQTEVRAELPGRNGREGPAAPSRQAQTAPAAATAREQMEALAPEGPAPPSAEELPQTGVHPAVAGLAQAAPAGGPINLNEADRETLLSLPGIGERTADKILQYRQEHGRIGSLQELQDADILFGHVAEGLRDRVTV